MILVVALGARLAVFFLALQDPGRFYTLDAHGYIAVARDLGAAYTDSASNLWAVGLSRTPGFPWLAAVVLSAWGSEAAVIVAQICLGLVALLLLHRLGRDPLGARVGLSAAAIVAIDPATVLY